MNNIDPSEFVDLFLVGWLLLAVVGTAVVVTWEAIRFHWRERRVRRWE